MGARGGSSCRRCGRRARSSSMWPRPGGHRADFATTRTHWETAARPLRASPRSRGRRWWPRAGGDDFFEQPADAIATARARRLRDGHETAVTEETARRIAGEAVCDVGCAGGRSPRTFRQPRRARRESPCFRRSSAAGAPRLPPVSRPARRGRRRTRNAGRSRPAVRSPPRHRRVVGAAPAPMALTPSEGSARSRSSPPMITGILP